jgi:hypothetical protein
MKVSEAIKMLSTSYSPDEEICISWWDKHLFFDEEISEDMEEAWSNAVSEFDAEEGYSFINERIHDLVRSTILEKTNT